MKVVLALVVGGFTLLGVWLGGVLTRSNEARHWRRDRCLEAYTDVLRACDTLVYESNRAYRTEFESSARLAQNEVVLDKTAEMYRASDRATLVGSDEVQKQLGALVLHCGKKIGAMSIARPKPTEDEWHKATVDDFAVLFGKFRNDARNDLGVNPPLHTVEEWKRILGRPN